MGILGSDVKEIKIKWDPNPGRPLFPGEVVNGKVILITEKDDVKIQKATIRFSGEISIHWVEEKTVRKKEGDEYVRHTVKIDHKSEHQLFSKTIEVVTNEEGSTVLENGENEYPFTMTLPKDLPSSYHTVFGWGLDYGKEHATIRYEAVAIADVPWGKDQSKKVEFFVQGGKDLNDHMETLEKTTEEKMKTFGCLCCESGPLNMKVTLNKNGFVPGEYIDIKAEVNNKSNKRIGGVYVVFYQYLVFHANGKKKNDNECVAYQMRKPSDPLIKSKVEVIDDDGEKSDNEEEGKDDEPEEKVDIKMKQSLGVVEPGAEELFEWCLKVPQLPPSMHDPNTMSIRYQLNFMADPDGAGFDLDLDPIPITIGSIPHKVAFPDFEAAPATDDNDDSNNSSIVSLPKHLEEKYPKLPGVLKGNTSTVWRNNRSRWVRYVEYSYKKK